MKLADTPDLGSGAARREGSSPSPSTNRYNTFGVFLKFESYREFANQDTPDGQGRCLTELIETGDPNGLVTDLPELSKQSQKRWVDAIVEVSRKCGLKDEIKQFLCEDARIHMQDRKDALQKEKEAIENSPRSEFLAPRQLKQIRQQISDCSIEYEDYFKALQTKASQRFNSLLQ